MRFLATVVAGLLLLLGGGSGVLAWNMETCTGNAPDSLYAGVVTLGLNLVGFLILAVNKRLSSTIIAIAAPALCAFSYSASTLVFVEGYLSGTTSACNILTGMADWPISGDEPRLAILWLLTCLSFWLGLVLVLRRGYRADAVETMQ